MWGGSCSSTRREKDAARAGRSPPAVPPAADRVDRTAGRVVIDADADPPFIALEIVDAVRDGFPVAGRRDHEIMDAHPVRSPFWTPGAAAILEVANQFFLLRVYRDRRLPLLLRPPDGLRNVPELGVPIRMLSSLARLRVA